MRILIISSYLPYPLFSGGHIRLYNLIKQLSSKHTITLICEKRDHQTQEDIDEVKKICKEVYTVPRKKQWSLGNILRSGFSKYPFLLIGHTSQEMKDTIVSVLNEKRYDVIHVETFYVFQNLPKTYLPTVLVEHNIEYDVYKRFVATTKAYLRPLLLLDIAKLTYWEKFFWEKATKLVAVSEKEKQVMKKDSVIIVPNGVDLSRFKFQTTVQKWKKKEKRVLFIGDFKWIQNTTSVAWILKDIWPKVLEKTKNKKELKNLKLWIVGKSIPESLKQLGDDTVLFDENAPDDTAKIYEKAHVLLAPIKVGGGTSYKILEAMASGVSVVTTELGIEGLQASSEKEALVGDSATQLASHVRSLLENEKLYEKITLSARTLVESNYTWEKIAKKLEGVYQSVV